VILVEPLQCQQNASLSNPDSFLGTEKSSKEQGSVSRGHKHHCVFSQKGGVLLTLQRFNKNRWQPLRGFLLKILDNVSSSGCSTGVGVSKSQGEYFNGD